MTRRLDFGLLLWLVLLVAGALGCDQTVQDDDTTTAPDDDDDTTGDDDTGVANMPPTVDDLPAQTVLEGELLDVDLTASDADGDDLEITGMDLPGFASLTDHGDGTATLALAPGYDDAGEYELAVQVDDGLDQVQGTVDLVVVRVPMVTTFIGSPGGAGTADGVGTDAFFFHPYGITQHDGLIYVSDGWGHTIRSFDPVTGEVSTIAGIPAAPGLVDSDAGTAQFNFPCGLEMGPDGLLYVADRRNGRIRTVDPVTGETHTLEDEVGVIVLQEPFDVTFLGDVVYFTDLQGCVIRRLDIVTRESGVTAGDPTDCRIFDGANADARLGEPRGVQAHPDGVLYYTDRTGESIRRIDLADGSVETLYGSGLTNEHGFIDGVGTDARFYDPSGLTLHEDRLYVADSDNDAIRMIDLATDEVSTLAGIGVNGNLDGPGDQASFSWPIDAIVGADGDLYVMDPGGHCVRHLDLDDPDHTVTTVAGAIGNSGSIDGVGTDGRLSEPRSLAHGEDGIVWLMDALNSEVRTIDMATAELVTVAGDAQVWGHLDGVGADARFMNPAGGVWLDDGRLIIVETASSTVRVVADGTFVVDTIAGQSMQAGFVDGAGLVARFNFPRDIALGYDGMAYVLDSGNRAVRRLNPNTYEVSTLLSPANPDNPLFQAEGIQADGAGTLYITDYHLCILVALSIDSGSLDVIAGAVDECEVVDGVGTAARLDGPQGMDYDPLTGLLYIASHDGHVVRVYDPATGELQTLAGDTERMAPVDGLLEDATFSTPVDVLVVEDDLLVLDRYSAHIRRVELP